jgi:hypothetical protein
MRPKPKITKVADGWQVERPRTGFGQSEVRGGFPSWEAAGAWLKTVGNLGSSSASFDRTTSPRGYWKHNSQHDAWPVIIR